MDQEMVVMEIICNAGEARSLCYEALRLARNNEITSWQPFLLMKWRQKWSLYISS